jgi:hypothetical protein
VWRDSTHTSVLKVIAVTPSMTSSLAALSVADLDVVQGLLRTELLSTSFAVHHEGAAYQEAFKKMEEVNRLRFEKLNLSDGDKEDPEEAMVAEAVASSSTRGK